MAVQANTLQRAKASGVGALSIGLGMSVLGSILHSADSVAAVAHIKWHKYLRAVYSRPPLFLAAFEAEARKGKQAISAEQTAGLAALVGLTVEERLDAV